MLNMFHVFHVLLRYLVRIMTWAESFRHASDGRRGRQTSQIRCCSNVDRLLFLQLFESSVNFSGAALLFIILCIDGGTIRCHFKSHTTTTLVQIFVIVQSAAVMVDCFRNPSVPTCRMSLKSSMVVLFLWHGTIGFVGLNLVVITPVLRSQTIFNKITF